MKLFLPSLARIVKVRQALVNKVEGQSTNDQNIENTDSKFYTKSIQMGLVALQKHTQSLNLWAKKSYAQTVLSTSTDFHETVEDTRSNDLVTENLLQNVVPPVGRKQNSNLVFADAIASDWYTAQSLQTLFSQFGKSKASDSETVRTNPNNSHK